LAEWILRNKGNDYLPFGSLSAARSLDEWRSERIESADRRAAHVARQHAEVHAKAARLTAKRDNAIHRQRAAQARKQNVEQIIKRLEALIPEARLHLIAADETIPLGALSKAVIDSLIDAVQQSTSDDRNRLLRRIDRRQSGIWKVLRRRLGEVRTRQLEQT
jgi:anti-sigma factor RsiW